MATELRLRRGTTDEHGNFIGAEAEATVDTDKNTIVVHDGQTQGGFPLAQEADTIPAVDSVSTLRASSFQANLDRLWLSGYYGVGTPGGGELYRVGSGFTSGDDNDVTEFVDLDGVKWARPDIGVVPVEWGGATESQGDIGAVINQILTNSPSGANILAAQRTYQCYTTIDLDIADTDSAIQLIGSGISAGSNPDNGTVIDGSAMSTDVLCHARSKSNFHLTIKGITFRAGSAGGILSGDRSAGHNASHSFIENIVVEGGSPGIQLESHTNSWINHIYSVNADGTGIRCDTMNACRFGIMTVRQAKGSWAADLVDGLGTNYGTLYLESNAKSALRIADDHRGSRIENIYTENNNTGATQSHEIVISDSSLSAEDTEAFEIGGMFLSTPANAYSVSQIGCENAKGLFLGPAWGSEDPLFSLIGSNEQYITFKGWSLPSTEEINLSNCAEFSKFTFVGCNINSDSLTLPTVSADIEFIGSNRTLNRLTSVYISDASDYTLLPWERHVVVDSDAGTQTTELPPNAMASGKVYHVVNEGASNNAVTVTGNGNDIIMGSASVEISDLSSASFVWEPTRARWMVVGRGSKS